MKKTEAEKKDIEIAAVSDQKLKAVIKLLLEKLAHLGVSIEGKSIIIKNGEITIK